MVKAIASGLSSLTMAIGRKYLHRNVFTCSRMIASIGYAKTRFA